MKENRIQKLEKLIKKHKELYYSGVAVIEDEEFDKLENELRELDPDNETLNIVGAKPQANKVKHDKKMLSLAKTYKTEDLEKFMQGGDLIATYKIDGSSCSILYDRGDYILAKTRGDGKTGENITSKVSQLEVPKKVKEKITFEVRGEIFCQENDFGKLSKEMVARGLDRPSSLRNIVAGLLGRKENTDLCRYLTFYAFELISEELDLGSEEEKFKKLNELGFQTPDYIHITKKEQINDYLKGVQDFISDGEYLIDGAVFTYNSLEKHLELGETSHHPRYKLAFKFQGDVKSSIIESISWQVSRNGILTPVANVEPVEISGAKISRVTLHNYGVVRDNNLKKGDKIKIIRSGEVIPKFIGVELSSSNKFEIPTKCPSCNKDIEVIDIRLVCNNDICPDKVKDTILNYIKKIGIDDLSDKRLVELIKNNMVTDVPSLYKLEVSQLLTLDKVKEKLANKIINNIQASKKTKLVTFLSALGISGGAYNKCEKIAEAGFDTIEKVLKLTVEDLKKIESFADKSANEFISSLAEKHSIIQDLIDLGVTIQRFNSAVDNATLAGKKFCITGSLSMKRSEVAKLIKIHGGESVSSVSKNTDFLITNDIESSSSKFIKAKDLKIPIINENKFLEMINEKGED